jgi:hypothetical protein
MPIERGTTSLLDVLDRVLDKGIVVDAWVCVSLVDIERIKVEECRVLTATDLNPMPGPGKSPLFGTFGSAASSHSALRTCEDNESESEASDSEA